MPNKKYLLFEVCSKRENKFIIRKWGGAPFTNPVSEFLEKTRGWCYGHSKFDLKILSCVALYWTLDQILVTKFKAYLADVSQAAFPVTKIIFIILARPKVAFFYYIPAR